MHASRSRTFVLWLLVVLVFCLSTPTRCQAGNIPWMTGTFEAYDAFSMFPVYSDGLNTSPSYFVGAQWLYWLAGNPVIPDVSWSYECDDVGYYCARFGNGNITAGSADGGLFQWDGTGFVQVATFTGTVTGGQVQKVEVLLGGVLTYWSYQYDYDFAGAWTNSWQTLGVVDGIDVDGYRTGTFTLTTNTPEPATITLIGLGLAGLSMRRRRRI
jgi:PEP-CTERM motif